MSVSQWFSIPLNYMHAQPALKSCWTSVAKSSLNATWISLTPTARPSPQLAVWVQRRENCSTGIDSEDGSGSILWAHRTPPQVHCVICTDLSTKSVFFLTASNYVIG
jgi:hypothetical protein